MKVYKCFVVQESEIKLFEVYSLFQAEQKINTLSYQIAFICGVNDDALLNVNNEPFYISPQELVDAGFIENHYNQFEKEDLIIQLLAQGTKAFIFWGFQTMRVVKCQIDTKKPHN